MHIQIDPIVRHLFQMLAGVFVLMAVIRIVGLYRIGNRHKRMTRMTRWL